MATPIRIVLYTTDNATAAKAADAAFSRFHQLNAILSDYDPQSELRRLCDTSGGGKAVRVSDDLWRVLSEAQNLSECSQGAFDVTIGPVVHYWRNARRTKELPSPKTIQRALQRVGYRSVRLDPKQHTVELLGPKMRLDLGGIAKGYAVDEAMAVLGEHGITRMLVDAGGNIGLGDPPPGKSGWRIGIAPSKAQGPPREYLWLANEGAHPTPDHDAVADPTALSVASSMTSWTRDPDALMALRHELGLYIEGSRETLPVLESTTEGHPRDAYYLNFQDPAGSPAADPLEIDEHTWLKVGWAAYDADAGMGWYGEYVDDPGIALYGYDDVAGYDDIERSYLYDDYGRDNLFEFALENGRYLVTLGVGRPAHGYPGDPHNATVEGTVLVDDEITTDEQPTLVRSVELELTDGLLSVEVGGLSESSGSWAYTFVSFLTIEPID